MSLVLKILKICKTVYVNFITQATLSNNVIFYCKHLTELIDTLLLFIVLTNQSN